MESILCYDLLNHLHDSTCGKINIGQLVTDDDSTLRQHCSSVENGGNLRTEINQPTFDGWFFWNISGLTRNVEIYTTITQSVLYFKIPEIFIQSNVIGFDTLLTEVFFTEKLIIMSAFNLSKYECFCCKDKTELS